MDNLVIRASPDMCSAPRASSTPRPAKLVRPWECSPTKPNRPMTQSPVNTSPVPVSPELHKMAAAVGHLAPNSRSSSPYCQLPDQLHHMIIPRQAVLLQKLRELCQTVAAAWPHQLYQGYQTSVKALLDERQRAFLMNQSVQGYDHKHLCLIESTFQQIHGLSQMSIAVSTATPTCRIQNVPSTPSPMVTFLNDSGYNSSQSTPNSLSPQPASPTTPEPPRDNTPVSTRTVSRRGRFLNNVAVQLMEEWYRVNFDHPYPTDAVVQQLAMLGNITTNQVKKWMANKRVRSCNTLSFNGSIHPKKLKRLQRQMAQSVGPMQQSPLVDSNRVLNDWVATHSQAPTSEEKRRLANETGLSLPQVKAWFASKRFRSQNYQNVQQSEYSLQVPAEFYNHVDPHLPLL